MQAFAMSVSCQISKMAVALKPERERRLVQFLEDPQLLKAYLKQHCSTQGINFSQYPWLQDGTQAVWREVWSLANVGEMPDGAILACVNEDYAWEYLWCDLVQF